MIEEKSPLAESVEKKQEELKIAKEQQEAMALRVKLTIWTGSFPREEIRKRLPDWTDDQLDATLWYLLKEKQIRKVQKDLYRLTYEGRRS